MSYWGQRMLLKQHRGDRGTLKLGIGKLLSKFNYFCIFY